MKTGFVAILGRPNVGKSTLLNAMLSKKVSIVTPKAQTTRDAILGILTQKDLQIVFVDTPGIFYGQEKLYGVMKRTAFESSRGVDAVLYLIDASVKSLDDDLKIFGDNGVKFCFRQEVVYQFVKVPYINVSLSRDRLYKAQKLEGTFWFFDKLKLDIAVAVKDGTLIKLILENQAIEFGVNNRDEEIIGRSAFKSNRIFRTYL